MKSFQVKAGTEPQAHAVAALEKHAFADLVRNRLAGHPQIAIDFGCQEVAWMASVLQKERHAHLRSPHLARMELLGGRNPHLAMQADVDDHTRGPQCLSGQPSELVYQIV